MAENKQIGDKICSLIYAVDWKSRKLEKSMRSRSINEIISGIVQCSTDLPDYLLSLLSAYIILFPFSLTVIIVVGFLTIPKNVYFTSFNGVIKVLMLILLYIIERVIFMVTLPYAHKDNEALTRLIVIPLILLGLGLLFVNLSPLTVFILIIIASYLLSVIIFSMFVDREITNLASLILFYNISLPMFSREFYKWLFSCESIAWIRSTLVKFGKRDKDDIYVNSPLARYLVSFLELIGITIVWVTVVSLVSVFVFTLITMPSLGESIRDIFSAYLFNANRFESLILIILILVLVIEFLVFVRGVLRVACVTKSGFNGINLTISLGNTKETSLLNYVLSVLNSLYAISLLGEYQKNEDQNRFVGVLLVSYLLGTVSQIAYRDIGKKIGEYSVVIFYYTLSEFLKIPLIFEGTQILYDKFERLQRILWDHKLEDTGYLLFVSKDIVYPDAHDGGKRSKNWIEVKYILEVQTHKKA